MLMLNSTGVYAHLSCRVVESLPCCDWGRDMNWWRWRGVDEVSAWVRGAGGARGVDRMVTGGGVRVLVCAQAGSGVVSSPDLSTRSTGLGEFCRPTCGS